MTFGYLTLITYYLIIYVLHHWTVFFIQLVYVHLMHMNASVISSIHTLACMQCSRKYVYEWRNYISVIGVACI